MKISKLVFEKIVREELAKHINALNEVGEVVDAENDHKAKDKSKDKQKDKSVDKKPVKQEPVEEPVDKDIEQDVNDTEDPEDPEDTEDPEDVTGGNIAKELEGKSIQSLTMEPKSKLMPGAQEIVLTFSQIPDPLRILIGKSGQVKFYFKGLHNKL